MPSLGKKKYVGKRLTSSYIFEGFERSGMLYFFPEGSQMAGRNIALEKSSCFQTLELFFKFFFFSAGTDTV